MESLAPYARSFSESGMRILESALNECRSRAQNLISPEHVLYALIIEKNSLFEAAATALSIDPEIIRPAVEKRLEKSSVYNGAGFEVAPETTDMFKASMDRARSQGRRLIDAEDLIFAFTAGQKYLFDKILNRPVEKKRPQLPNSPPSELSGRTETNIGSHQAPIWLQNKDSKFPSGFSAEEVVRSNDLLSAFKPLGQSGGAGCSVMGSKIRYNKHSYLGFYSEDKSILFKHGEIIVSLKKDMRNHFEKNGLMIVKTESTKSEFSFHYRGSNLIGRILITIQISSDHLQISVNQDETYLRKR